MNLGWKLGEGSEVAKKNVAGYSVVIEYHRTKMYFVQVTRRKAHIGAKFNFDGFEEVLSAANSLCEVLLSATEKPEKEAKPKAVKVAKAPAKSKSQQRREDAQNEAATAV